MSATYTGDATIETFVVDALRSRVSRSIRLTSANCRPGPMQPVTLNAAAAGAWPTPCVAVIESGGFASMPYIDGGNGSRIERPSVQVRIRSAPRNYAQGRALVDECFAALEMNPPSRCIECRATSRPIYLGEDPQNHHEWSINFTLDVFVGA